MKCANSRYNNTLLLSIFFLLDYFALVTAEQAAFVLRNTIINNTSLHISWLNFWVIFPLIFLMFIQINQLYTRRMPFYKEVEHLFRSCVYGILAVILELYAVQIAASTSRLFVGFFAVLAFIFLAVFRYAAKKFLMKRDLLQIPVIIIGAGKTAELLVRTIKNDAGIFMVWLLE